MKTGPRLAAAIGVLLTVGLLGGTAAAQQATLQLPTTLEVFHTAEHKWPTRLVLAGREGSIGQYTGFDYQGRPARGTAQLYANGSMSLDIEVPNVGYHGHYDGRSRTGNLVEGTYHPSSGFGPPAPFQALLGGETTRTEVPSGDVHTISQPAQRDTSGRIVREAAIIHVVQCPNAQAGQIYVYEYQERPGFRAIRPPDWGHPLGGRDFATREEATSAGCLAPR